jgi:hypothetical protein
MVFSFFSYLGKGKWTPSILHCKDLYFNIYHEEFENSLIDKDLVIVQPIWQSIPMGATEHGHIS